jgi:DNA invertase Pin-like site-specific DNA recombinase
MPRRRKVSPEREEEFRRLWRSGTPVTELARHFGCSVTAVADTRARLDLSPRPTARRGPRPGKRKIPPAEEARFRRLWRDRSVRAETIALAYGLSLSGLGNVRRRLGEAPRATTTRGSGPAC